MGTNKVININGELFNEQDAKISVFDRGFLFGDSVYEVTLTYNFKPYQLDEHLERMWNSAGKMAMPLNFTKQELSLEIEKTIKTLGEPRCYLRFIATRGVGEIGLDPALPEQNNLVIIASPLPQNPTWWYEKGVHVVVARTKRTSPKSLDPSIKSGNYLSNIMAYNEAKRQGAFDAIMLNARGFITEGTTNNFWHVRNDELITAPLEAGLLGGITRKTLISLAKANGITVREELFMPRDLENSSECFLTSTTKVIVPVVKIGEQDIGTGSPGPVTKKLLGLFKDYILENYSLEEDSPLKSY
jgi:branched-chain amino acid aminotransferase